MNFLEVQNSKITTSGNFPSDDLIKLETDYKSTLAELGRDANTAQLVTGLAHLEAFYLDSADEAVENLEEAIDFPNISKPVQARCKLELGDIYLFTGNVWDSDL